MIHLASKWCIQAGTACDSPGSNLLVGDPLDTSKTIKPSMMGLFSSGEFCDLYLSNKAWIFMFLIAIGCRRLLF